MVDINDYINFAKAFPRIGNAFAEGAEEGRVRNALAFASKNYATNPQAAANALMSIGDVRSATAIMENVRQAEQDRLARERQTSIDELNRRNIESEIATRQAAGRQRDIRAVGSKMVDFTDPNNPRVVYSEPTLADELGLGQGSQGGVPTGNIPAGAPHPFQRTAVAPPSGAMPSPEVAQTFGPRVVTQPSLTPGGTKGDYGGGNVGVAPAPTAPVARRTLADLTPQEKLTAAQMDRLKPGTGRQYIIDILSGKAAEEQAKATAETQKAQASAIPMATRTAAETADRYYDSLSKAIDDYKALIEKTGMTYLPGQEKSQVHI